MHVPKIMYLYVLIWVVFTNLSFRDYLPQWMCTDDKKSDEDSILVTLVIFHVLNYNSYLSTLLFLPASILVGYYLQMLKQVEIVSTIDAPHWGGGTLETQADMESYVIDKMFTITVLVALILAHTYLI